MDIFDQYLLEELVSEYERSGLTNDDYEELYIRFCNLNHLEEVKPYLLVMRYLGLGTPAEPDAALNELKGIMEDNIELTGLYNDLKLCTNPKNTGATVELRRSIEDGYCGKYLRNRSNIGLVKKVSKEEQPSTPVDDNTVVDDTIHYKYMRFEGCGYSGLNFTTRDIDYLNARIFIEPMKATRKIKVCSQIFSGDNAFSQVFYDEITLKPGSTSFATSGLGNKNYNCYEDGTYRWRIEIDGVEVYSQDFRFYAGEIDKHGIPIKDVKLFASKASGATEADRKNYAHSFDSSTLEYVNFKCFIDEPGEDKIVQLWLKVTCVEDDTIIYDNYYLHSVHYDTCAFGYGVGFSSKGEWKQGLYKYTIRIGAENTQEGTFTVY